MLNTLIQAFNLITTWEVVVAERVGFILTAAIIVYVTATALGARWKLALPLTVGAPIVIHLIFSKLLRVPLPIGLLPMPW